MLGHGDCGMSYDKCSVGWLMGTKLEHSRSNSNTTNQLVLTNLEHSTCMPNSNKTSQLCNMFWTLTFVTLKSRSNQKPGHYVDIYHCTCIMIIVWRWSSAISSGVISVCLFLVLAPWWPSQESNWTKILSVSYSYVVVYMYKVLGQ
jgi:hypothetical protein